MGKKWGYECWTPEGQRNYAALQEDRDQTSFEYECAYDIVRAAMALFETPDLRTLKNALHFASTFVNDELEEMPDEAQELGLDKWIEHEEEERVEEEWQRQEEERQQKQAKEDAALADE